MTWDAMTLEQKLNDLHERLNRLEMTLTTPIKPPVKKGKK